MDRQDAKPSRPSLLTGATSGIAPLPAGGRILADMEIHREPPGTARSKKRGTRTSVLVAAVLVAMLAGGYALVRGRGHPLPPYPAGLARPPTAPPASPPLPLPTASETGSAALIVDAPQADEPSPFSDFEAQGLGASSGMLPPAPAVAMAGVPRPSAAKPSPPVSNRAAATPAAPPANGDLIAGLLHNIEQRAPREDRTGGGRSPMDDLVQQIRSQNSQARGGPAPQPQEVQARLRRCPKANTARGVECRQRICERFAGRDPACPAAQ